MIRYTRGNTFRLSLKVVTKNATTGVQTPVSLAGDTWEITIRDAADTVVLYRSSTANPTQVQIEPAAETGRMIILIPFAEAEAAMPNAGKGFRIDLQRTDAAGIRTTPINDTLAIVQDQTR